MSIKTTIILASSLAALPISILLIGSAIQRRKRNSTLTQEFLKQTNSTTPDNNTIARVDHVQKPEVISQRTLPIPSQRPEINTATRAKGSPVISPKSIHNRSNIPIALRSPIMPSSTSGNGVIVSHQTPREDETSISDNSKEAGESLRELIVAAVKEAKDSAKETGHRVKEKTIDISAPSDSKVIRSLGDDVGAQVNLFEETLGAIRKESYDNQIKLLDSYKEFLQKQIKVIHARSKIARTLRPGS